MTTTTEQALYSVGQLVEFRDGPGRPYDKTGRVTEVRRQDLLREESGGWEYRLEAAGDRPRANGGKYQNNVRPLFEDGDVVWTSQDAGTWESYNRNDAPNGFVSERFKGVEVTVRPEYRGNLRNEFGNYNVVLPDGGTQWVAPEHLTLVRKAGESEPLDPNVWPQWIPQLGDIAVVDGRRVTVGRLYNQERGDVGFDYDVPEGRTFGTVIPSGWVRDGSVRLAERPTALTPENPVAERLAFEPRVGDDVMALEFDNRPGGRYVRATVTAVTESTVRPYRVTMLEGERSGSNYGRSITMLRPLETPTTPAPEPRPFNVRDVKIGDKVEVYATENGEPFAGGNEYIQDGDGLGAWRLGTVVHTDPGDSLPLGVQVEGAGDWWWFKTFQIRQAASQEPETPQERRPFNWRDVKVGDEVEVYASASGSRLSSPTAPMGAWQRGTVSAVEDPGYGGTLALRVRVLGTSHWREEGTVRWPLAAPAPEVRGEAVAPQPDLLELAKKAAADKAVAELKSTIGDRAMALAKEHGWCSETEEALRLMGIDPNIQIGGEVTVKFRVSAELMSRVRSEPVLVDNPARFLKENIVPKLEGLGGLTAHDVQVMEVQVNRVSKTRKEA